MAANLTSGNQEYTNVPTEESSRTNEEQTLLELSPEEDLPPLTLEEEHELLSEVIEIDRNTQPLINSRINPTDGVFSNMSAKPTQGKIFEEIEPPSYHEVVIDPSPDYLVSCMDETGEILFEGLPVGDYFLFLLNTFISMTFDVLGFFMTSLMATTHAARFGSQNGLGLTLVRYGFLLKKKVEEMDFNNMYRKINYREYDNGYRPDPEEEKSRREWTAYFIIFMGAFLLLRSNIEFIRLRRMKAAVQGSSSFM
jgi:hypothetical protein